VVPLPGSDRPTASVRQFIELAVTMPEQDPHVGQAASSSSASRSSDTEGSAEAIIGSMRSILVTPSAVSPSARVTPASIGPPETNTAGGVGRSAAPSTPRGGLLPVERGRPAAPRRALPPYPPR